MILDLGHLQMKMPHKARLLELIAALCLGVGAFLLVTRQAITRRLPRNTRLLPRIRASAGGKNERDNSSTGDR